MPFIDAREPQAIDAAARRLAAGELLAFPTETVYGLGARADDDAAVAKVFAAKGRPAGHPLIVHTADAAHARGFAAGWPDAADRLADAFWPGPLTLIVRRIADRARAAAGGHDTIGLRVPSHPVAQALLRAAHALGVAGVAAPSANRFGRVSATRADHVAQEFGADLWVLDAGPCPGGIESAIVDVSGPRPVLLRPGAIDRGRIESVLGTALADRQADSPRAPGTLAAHYAPTARLRLMPTDQLRDALGVLGSGSAGLKLAVYSRSCRPNGPQIGFRRMPDDAAQAAQELFAVLREFDAQGVQIIWVEQPPQTADWEGVADRLRRAAAA